MTSLNELLWWINMNYSIPKEESFISSKSNEWLSVNARFMCSGTRSGSALVLAKLSIPSIDDADWQHLRSENYREKVLFAKSWFLRKLSNDLVFQSDECVVYFHDSCRKIMPLISYSRSRLSLESVLLRIDSYRFVSFCEVNQNQFILLGLTFYGWVLLRWLSKNALFFVLAATPQRVMMHFSTRCKGQWMGPG